MSTFLLVNLLLAHGSKHKTLRYTIHSEQENIAAVASQQIWPFNKEKHTSCDYKYQVQQNLSHTPNTTSGL